ncbi:hypothetical protein DPMN_105933 [Dreissena polymorpha]|uniref:Uncharacterized protein n=1 Tax=Dreissena polymorpha TaxID=45954 RepID=A0A9D4K429_DREPO|nr:hypothetical protein DPMN_105933 [Dreissena polymorpha]
MLKDVESLETLPVTIMVLMFALLSWLMTWVVSGFSLFSMMMRPRKVRPRSTCSLYTRSTCYQIGAFVTKLVGEHVTR